MIEEDVIVKNPTGLDAGMATPFVQIASRHTSRVTVQYEDKKVNAKSIMSILALAVAPGETITIKARGEDEREAVEALIRYVQTGEGSPYPL